MISLQRISDQTSSLCILNLQTEILDQHGGKSAARTGPAVLPIDLVCMRMFESGGCYADQDARDHHMDLVGSVSFYPNLIADMHMMFQTSEAVYNIKMR